MFEEKNLEKGIENGVRKKQKGRMREEWIGWEKEEEERIGERGTRGCEGCQVGNIFRHVKGE
jgi:hypothetical protein